MGWFTTKKDLKKQIEELIEQNNKIAHDADELLNELNYRRDSFPFKLGDTVFDVQLRSDKGRFTKTKASREHSLINEVIVDKKNYFNLVDRYNNSDVFFTRARAEKYLNEVCVD